MSAVLIDGCAVATVDAAGTEIADQPVLAIDEVRFAGEPVAIVAADHPETARRAAARIVVDYEVLEAVTDARAAMSPGDGERRSRSSVAMTSPGVQ